MSDLEPAAWRALFLVGFLAFLGGVVYIVVSHLTSHEHHFKPGDLVALKLDHRVGVVTNNECWNNNSNCYFVQFPDNQDADTHFIEPNGPVKTVPYSVVKVMEAELEEAPQ